MHNRLFFLKSLKWRREDFPVLSILWWLAIIINNIQMSSYLSFSLVHISSFYLTTTICLSYNLSVCKIALTFIQPYMQIMTQDDRSSYFVIFVTFYVFTFSEVHGKLYQFWYDMLLGTDRPKSKSYWLLQVLLFQVYLKYCNNYRLK